MTSIKKILIDLCEMPEHLRGISEEILLNKYKKEIIDEALKEASNIPFKTLKCCCEIMLCVKELAENGNPNSISDVGVGAEMAYAGAEGAALNVKINLKEINDIQYCQKMQKHTDSLIEEIRATLEVVRETVLQKINYD